MKIFEGINISVTLIDSILAADVDAGRVQYLLSADKKFDIILFGTMMVQSKELRVVIEGVKIEAGVAIAKYGQQVTVINMILL
ncbi:hypothetical protein ACWFRC_27820 [Bacillus cereus]